MKAKKITAMLMLVATELAFLAVAAVAQENDWRDEMQYLVYTPRYFGANAFPLPELHDGRLSARFSVEARGEYHSFTGDRTKDVFLRAYLPVAQGQAAVEINFVAYEYYNMTAATVAERHAAGGYWPNGAHGDVIFNAYYQLLRSWLDVTAQATLKTASGNRLVDARYTDAAAYWFDLNAGRRLYASDCFTVRLNGLAGFYCWMTNDMIHRQNDALVYSAGVSADALNLSFSADIAGLYGYENKGDRPQQLRTKIEYEYRNNALSLRYRHGLNDALYDTFSIGYVRYF
jgi:hypothetical protein